MKRNKQMVHTKSKNKNCNNAKNVHKIAKKKNEYIYEWLEHTMRLAAIYMSTNT